MWPAEHIREYNMLQSLDFVLRANQNPADKKRIIEALSSETASEIIVNRHKLSFDPDTRYVTVDKASENVPFACKIVKCKMPYDVLKKLLNGNSDDLTGIEWL